MRVTKCSRYNCNLIPSQKIAIEYQGKQHYDEILFLGGKEALDDNRTRDIKKKQLAEENGIKIVYWDYMLEIKKENVIKFFEENEIVYLIEKIDDEQIVEGIDMAPPPETKKKKGIACHRNGFVVQYDLQGNYVQKYFSVREAAEKSGAGVSSINKVLTGKRNSAGRYVWRRFLDDCIPPNININFDISKINDGLKK